MDLKYIQDRLPPECVKECTQADQDNTEACLRWLDKLEFVIPYECCIEMLREEGNWDTSYLRRHTHRELKGAIIWLAAGIQKIIDLDI